MGMHRKPFPVQKVAFLAGLALVAVAVPLSAYSLDITHTPAAPAKPSGSPEPKKSSSKRVGKPSKSPTRPSVPSKATPWDPFPPKTSPSPSKPPSTPSPSPSKSTPKPNPTYGSGVNQYELDVFGAILYERREWCGPDTLKMNPDLNEYAKKWSETLAKESTGSIRHSKLDFSGSLRGEILAAGRDDPLKTVQDWIGSPTHRAEIMECSYDRIGVGYVTGGKYGHYWTVVFVKH